MGRRIAHREQQKNANTGANRDEDDLALVDAKTLPTQLRDGLVRNADETAKFVGNVSHIREAMFAQLTLDDDSFRPATKETLRALDELLRALEMLMMGYGNDNEDAMTDAATFYDAEDANELRNLLTTETIDRQAL